MLLFMNTMMIVISFIVIIAATVGFRDDWVKEIKDSLKSNIHGRCEWTESSEHGIIPNEDKFFVSFHLPTKDEYNNFTSIPHTLSKISLDVTNKAVHEKLVKHGSKKGTTNYLPEHPTQNRAECVNIVRYMNKNGIVDLYQDYKYVKRTAYLLRAKNAIVHPSGYVGVSCGYFQGREGCESRHKMRANAWYQECSHYFTKYEMPWNAPWMENHDFSEYDTNFMGACSFENKNPIRLKKVFVLTALWDDNFAHFLMDGMARMVRHIDFLRENTDVKILIRHFHDNPQHIESGLKMKLRLFEMLGISSSRVVYGTVLAEEVFVPRPMTCGYSLFNPLEIRLLAKYLLEGAKIQAAKYWESKGLDPKTGRSLEEQISERKKYLIVQQRDKNAKNPGRGWSQQTTKLVVRAFENSFPDHQVLKISSISQTAPDYCAACEIVQYSQAEILVGMHGAGLINMIFMPPEGLVVEISNDFNGLNYPFCAYIGPQCALSGHHHFLFSFELYSREKLDSHKLAEESKQYYLELQSYKNSSSRKANFPIMRNFQFYSSTE